MHSLSEIFGSVLHSPKILPASCRWLRYTDPCLLYKFSYRLFHSFQKPLLHFLFAPPHTAINPDAPAPITATFFIFLFPSPGQPIPSL